MTILPYGDDLVSNTVDVSGLVKDAVEDVTITFGAGTTATSGQSYAVVLRCPTGTYVSPGENNAVVLGQDTGAGYGNGAKCLNLSSGIDGSWTEIANRDIYFVTYAGAVEKDKYETNNALQFIYGVNWAAGVFAASSTFTLTSVKLRLGRSSQATNPGVLTVSIKNARDRPTKATTPSPTNGVTNVSTNLTALSWVDGGDADTYDVYVGTASGNLSLVSSGQVGTTFSVAGVAGGSPYDHFQTQYWRIDSNNATGTTTGDEWSFRTLRIDPPSQTHFYLVTGQYYRLLVQAGGTYGDPPGVGVENVDYVYLTAGYAANAIVTTRKLVSVANSKIWIEDI